MTKSLTAGLLALAALTATAIAVPAMAHAVSASMSVHISYRDLDISRPEGAAILKNRIQAVAARVCGGDVDDRELGRLASAAKCRAEALHGAEMQMEAARLARIDGEKTITVASREVRRAPARDRPSEQRKRPLARTPRPRSRVRMLSAGSEKPHLIGPPLARSLTIGHFPKKTSIFGEGGVGRRFDRSRLDISYPRRVA